MFSFTALFHWTCASCAETDHILTCIKGTQTKDTGGSMTICCYLVSFVDVNGDSGGGEQEENYHK